MILVFGGKTGGLGQPLFQHLSADYPLHEVAAISRQTCDVESEESIEKFFHVNFHGPLHIINATGASISAMIHKADITDIMRMIRVNLVSNILLLKHARPLYKEHGGTFTMLSSVTAHGGPAGTAVYSATKSALYALTRTAAKEFASLETRVNCLELGYFSAGMIDQIPGEQLQRIVDKIPVGTLGSPAALAQACKFLIDCDYMTGAIVPVDGGI